MSVWRLIHVRLTCLISALMLAVSPASEVRAQELYFIDAHSQVDQDVDAKTIIANMKAAGVHLTILSVRSGRKPNFVIQLSAKFPERIVPSVTTKMWGYIIDSEKPHKKIPHGTQGPGQEWQVQGHVRGLNGSFGLSQGQVPAGPGATQRPACYGGA